MPKINITTLRKIISEEIKLLREGESEKQAASQAQSASKLLDAIESFKGVATSKATAEMGNHLDEAEKLLKRIVGSPMQYVDAAKPKPATNKVSFKPSKEDEVI